MHMKSILKERNDPRLNITSWALSLLKWTSANLVFLKVLLTSALLIILNICSNTLVSGHNSFQSLPFLWKRVILLLRDGRQWRSSPFNTQLIKNGSVNTDKYIWPEILFLNSELPRTQAVMLAQGSGLATMAILPKGELLSKAFWHRVASTWK